MSQTTAVPVRLQLSRAKGYRMPPNTLKVDRSTRWGNPFNATQIAVPFPHPDTGFPIELLPLRIEPSLSRCVDLYTAWLRAKLDSDPHYLAPLRGRNLGCWCPIDSPCHADVLLRLANRLPVVEQS